MHSDVGALESVVNCALGKVGPFPGPRQQPQSWGTLLMYVFPLVSLPLPLPPLLLAPGTPCAHLLDPCKSLPASSAVLPPVTRQFYHLLAWPTDSGALWG